MSVEDIGARVVSAGKCHNGCLVQAMVTRSSADVGGRRQMAGPHPTLLSGGLVLANCGEDGWRDAVRITHMATRVSFCTLTSGNYVNYLLVCKAVSTRSPDT